MNLAAVRLVRVRVVEALGGGGGGSVSGGRRRRRRRRGGRGRRRVQLYRAVRDDDAIVVVLLLLPRGGRLRPLRLRRPLHRRPHRDRPVQRRHDPAVRFHRALHRVSPRVVRIVVDAAEVVRQRLRQRLLFLARAVLALPRAEQLEEPQPRRVERERPQRHPSAARERRVGFEIFAQARNQRRRRQLEHPSMHRDVRRARSLRGVVPRVQLLVRQRDERLHRLPAQPEVIVIEQVYERDEAAGEDEPLRERPSLRVAQVQRHEVGHLASRRGVIARRAIRRRAYQQRVQLRVVVVGVVRELADARRGEA
eukprot:29049-Pelagococcus_subviridis.AAC.2